MPTGLLWMLSTNVGKHPLDFLVRFSLEKNKQEKELLSIASFSNNHGGVILRVKTLDIWKS